MAGLEVRDHSAGDVVVRRDDPVDLVVRLDQHLSEDRACVRREPVGDELLRPLRQLPALEEGIQDVVVAALEPLRVLVGERAPELGDDRLRLALERGVDAGGLCPSDLVAVEGHVDGRGAAEHLAVVVDRLPARRSERLLDCRGGAVVQRGLDDHLGTGGEARLSLCFLLLWVVQRVRDRVGHAGRLQCLGDRRSVELHPPHGRLRVRQEDANLNVRLLLTGAAAGCGDGDRRNRGGPDQEQHRRPSENLLHFESPSVAWPTGDRAHRGKAQRSRIRGRTSSANRFRDVPFGARRWWRMATHHLPHPQLPHPDAGFDEHALQAVRRAGRRADAQALERAQLAALRADVLAHDEEPVHVLRERTKQPAPGPVAESVERRVRGAAGEVEPALAQLFEGFRDRKDELDRGVEPLLFEETELDRRDRGKIRRRDHVGDGDAKGHGVRDEPGYRFKGL